MQYGVIGLACLVFAAVIIFLYKRNEARIEKYEKAVVEMAAERASFAQRESSLRAEMALREVMLRKELAEDKAKQAAEYAQELRDLRTGAQVREDAIRHEYTEVMEAVSAEATKQASAVANVLDKAYDRFAPRRRDS